MARRKASSLHAALRRKWAKDGEYERLGEKQKWHCGICGKLGYGKDGKVGYLLRGKHVRFDIDHNHRENKLTGYVPRGLLCRGCNLRLRQSMTPSWLRAAADYLDKE